MGHTVAAFSDEPTLLIGFESVLRDCSDFSFVHMTNDARHLAAVLAEALPDILVMDWVPGVDLETVRNLRSVAPGTRIILWAREIAPEAAYQAIELGVRGVLPRTLPRERVIECLSQVAAGEMWLERSLTLTLLTARPISLTRRERQLVELLSRGFKNKEIATSLGISEGTVKVYLSRLFEKVGAKDRFELALFGLQHIQWTAPRVVPSDRAVTAGAGPRTLLLRR